MGGVEIGFFRGFLYRDCGAGAQYALERLCAWLEDLDSDLEYDDGVQPPEPWMAGLEYTEDGRAELGSDGGMDGGQCFGFKLHANDDYENVLDYNDAMCAHDKGEYDREKNEYLQRVCDAIKRETGEVIEIRSFFIAFDT